MGHPSSKPCTHPTHHLEPVCHVRKDLTPSELDGHKSTFIIDIHTPLPCQQHQEILKSPSVSVFPISPPTSTQGTISPASLKGLATAASAARSEAGSTRWRCSRVCSGQLINTSSSCKILKFQKNSLQDASTTISWDVEDSASRWLRKHHLPSDLWG